MLKTYEIWELLKMASEYGEYDKPIEKRPMFESTNYDEKFIVTFDLFDGHPGIIEYKKQLLPEVTGTLLAINNVKFKRMNTPVSLEIAINAFKNGKRVMTKKNTKDRCYFDEFKIGHREWINLKDILDVEYYIIEEGE